MTTCRTCRRMQNPPRCAAFNMDILAEQLDVPDRCPRWVGKAATEPDIPRPRLLHDTSAMSPAEFSEWRQGVTTLGSSDAAEILFGSPVAWLEKRRGLRKDDGYAKLAALGHALEPHTLELASTAMGRDVTRDGKAWLHPTIDCLHTTPDGVTSSGALVEAKAPKGLYARREALDILERYGWEPAFSDPWVRAKFVQCQHHLAVRTDAPYCWLAVLADESDKQLLLAGLGHMVDPSSLRLIRVDRELSIIDRLETELPKFHRLMQDPDWWPKVRTQVDFEAWSRSARFRTGHTVEADEATTLAVIAADDGRSREKEGKEDKQTAKATIAAFMGDAQVLEVEGFKVARDKRGIMRITRRKG